MKVKSESEVAQSCPTLSDPMDRSPPDSSIHGILQARVLEWDYCDCVVNHPEPDILECKVKWVLRLTEVNKARGCDEIPAELFKSLKEDAIKVLHSLRQQIWKTQQWPQDWKRSILISISKNGSTKKCANHWIIALTSYASKVILKILYARLQHYVNEELPDVQAWFRKRRGNRDQVANIHWIIEKMNEFQKNIYLCFIDYIKSFVWIMTNWTALREMGISNHLICLLRNLYAGQETTV